MRDGCPNCETILSLAGSAEAIQECTSQVYEGLVTLSDPAQSWVAKWQRLDTYVGGVYATKVVGTVCFVLLLPTCLRIDLDFGEEVDAWMNE